MVVKSMLLLLLASSVFGYQIPPEWRDVIQSLCANAVPPSSVQICYGRHVPQMQVSYFTN